MPNKEKVEEILVNSAYLDIVLRGSLGTGKKELMTKRGKACFRVLLTKESSNVIKGKVLMRFHN